MGRLKRGGGFEVTTTAGFLSVVTKVTVLLEDEKVSTGCPGRLVVTPNPPDGLGGSGCPGFGADVGSSSPNVPELVGQ